MNHFKISTIKSTIRIIGCIVSAFVVFFNAVVAVFCLSALFLIAEILGIFEEVFDKRKEL